MASFVRYKKSQIDATAVSTIKLFTTDNNGLRFIATNFHIETTALTNFTSNPIFRIGTVAGGYADVKGSISPSLGVINRVQHAEDSVNLSIPPKTDVFIDITAAAVADVMKLRIDTEGYYSN